MQKRLTYRRRLSYNTQSNRRQPVKTPGGKLVYQYKKKMGTIPRCGDCKETLRGLKPARPRQLRAMSRRLKTVTRAYGGSRCHRCVRNRIMRAFLVEEQRIVVSVLKSKRLAEKRKEAAEERVEKEEKKKGRKKKKSLVAKRRNRFYATRASWFACQKEKKEKRRKVAAAAAVPIKKTKKKKKKK